MNSLLHLYMVVGSSKRFTPRVVRNSILSKYIQSKIKVAEYKCVKPELKQLFLTGRSKNADLEAKLIELYELDAMTVPNKNDVKKLFDMIELLKSEHGFNTELHNDSKPRKPDVIYIVQEHIDLCFNNDGELVSPITLQIESKRSIKLVNIITSINLFQPELIEFNELKWQANVLLHPIAQRNAT